ncbi:hypothetical protein GCM10028805_19030 [Spirosoma harenae]
MAWFLHKIQNYTLLNFNLLTVPTMKKALLGLALLTSLTAVSYAVDTHKEKKVKKAKSSTCEKGSSHACCMKKAQV